jgi:hypothetical protein
MIFYDNSFDNVDDLIQQHPEIQHKDFLRKSIENDEFIKIINYSVARVCNSYLVK